MFFDLLLYGSLSVFFIGLVNKVYIWFSRRIVQTPLDFRAGQRLGQALRGIFGVFHAPHPDARPRKLDQRCPF